MGLGDGSKNKRCPVRNVNYKVSLREHIYIEIKITNMPSGYGAINKKFVSILHVFLRDWHVSEFAPSSGT